MAARTCRSTAAGNAPNFFKGLDGFEISCYDPENIFLLFFLLFLDHTISFKGAKTLEINRFISMENYMMLL